LGRELNVTECYEILHFFDFDYCVLAWFVECKSFLGRCQYARNFVRFPLWAVSFGSIRRFWPFILASAHCRRLRAFCHPAVR